jgi:hypothetical protein
MKEEEKMGKNRAYWKTGNLVELMKSKMDGRITTTV